MSLLLLSSCNVLGCDEEDMMRVCVRFVDCYCLRIMLYPRGSLGVLIYLGMGAVTAFSGLIASVRRVP